MKEYEIINVLNDFKVLSFKNANKFNKQLYKENECNGFVCLVCGDTVSKSNSVSRQGQGLICDDCRCKIQLLLGMTDEEFIKQYTKEADKRERGER